MLTALRYGEEEVEEEEEGSLILGHKKPVLACQWLGVGGRGGRKRQIASSSG